MTCEACEKARRRPTSGLFHAGCDGCAARSLARTPQFFQAAREGRLTPEYRMALTNLLPTLPAADAHAAVKAWLDPPRYQPPVTAAVSMETT